MNLVEIIPLGGAGEIGRNSTILRQGDDMILIDCGISFPNEEMHGVDIIIPDFSFVRKHKSQLRGIFLTHAHEDHVGALSWLLNDVKCPVYGTEFTLAMVRSKLEEKIDTKSIILKTVTATEKIKAGALSVEFIPVTHSIPSNSSLAIHTDHGIVIFTGDFKFDFTPVDGQTSHLHRFAELGQEGVVCLLSDSTNVDRPGWGPSESSATEGYRRAFAEAEGRILITMFSSNIHRMQQAMDVAFEQGRKVAIAGRRMQNTVEMCIKLGYIKAPKGVLIRLEEVHNYEKNQIVILLTGSQGEPMAALVQMSRQEYSRLQVAPGDTILYSARPIPGNEAVISRTINRLILLGAVVLTDCNPPIHVSGHAYQEELKMMISLTKPFYLAPVHGEPRHQYLYGEMAKKMGHLGHRIFQLKDGESLKIDDTKAVTEEVLSGQPILIDASGKHFVDPELMKVRFNLSEHGVVTVSLSINDKGHITSDPVLTARGFSGPEQALQKASDAVYDKLKSMSTKDLQNDDLVRSQVADAIKVILQRACQARPEIIIVLV